MFPKTNTGRALTIVYALIGIPLFLIALTDFGKLFTRGIKFVWSFVRRLYYTGSCRNARKNSGVDVSFTNLQTSTQKHRSKLELYRISSKELKISTIMQLSRGHRFSTPTPPCLQIQNKPRTSPRPPLPPPSQTLKSTMNSTSLFPLLYSFWWPTSSAVL